MTRSVIGVVYRKEMRETLRDRRTLFVMIVLPILLYPLLMIGLTRVTAERQRALSTLPHRVAIEGAAAELAAFLRSWRPESGEGLEVRRVPDLETALRDGDIAVGVRVGDDFEEAIAAKRPTSLELLFDNTEERSLTARARLRAALADYGEQLLERRLESPEHLRPFASVEVETSGVGTVSVFASKVLGLIVVLMTLTACFYPAVDLAAGEKERGTLETLLVSPVNRSELVIGKYLAVVTVAIGAATLNLVAMALTFSQLFLGVPGAVATAGTAIGPGQVAAMLVLLVPLCALFGAAALALSTFARSYKEGLHYLTPLAALVTPLAIVAALPAIQLDPGLAMVPVTGTVLLFRDLLLGRADLALGAISFASTAFVAALFLSLCVRFFRREEVLFRRVGIGGLRALRDEARRRGHPTAGEAFLLFVIALALIWFVAPRFATSVGLILALQLAVILLPVAAYVAAFGFRIAEVFPTARTGPRPWIAALLFAAAGFAMALRAKGWLMKPDDLERLRPALESLLALPLVAQLALLALLPAVCEETFFRGFVLRGLRTELRPLAAALVGGLLFGAMHLSLAKLPGTTLVGFLLGVVVVRSGSILPAILAHFVHNALAIVPVGAAMERWVVEWPVGSAVVAFGAGVVAIGVGFRLLRPARR